MRGAGPGRRRPGCPQNQKGQGRQENGRQEGPRQAQIRDQHRRGKGRRRDPARSILEKLRYTIPFADPEATFDYLRPFAREAERPLVAFVGDDGEKFGVWPGTHKHCYRDAWLERFFARWEELLEEFPSRLPREVLADTPPLGRTYIPAGSYPELMAWSLPAAAGRAYEAAGRLVEEKGIRDAVRPFLRGGLWTNFLAKYPESNHIHKKMLWVGERIGRVLAADRSWKTSASPTSR